MYAAVHAALEDPEAPVMQAAAPGGATSPPTGATHIEFVRNLRSAEWESAASSRARAADVRAAFDAGRWSAFEADVAFFASRMGPQSLQALLVDYGLNATPFWITLGAPLASAVPLADATLVLLASIDLALIVGMLAAVRAAFGPAPALLAAIFFFANPFATFDVTGGGLLRQLWLLALVAFVCLYARGVFIGAGLALAVAAADRVFPALFALLPATTFVSAALRRDARARGSLRCLAALTIGVATLAGVGEAVCGPGAWRDWYDKIRVHNRGYFTNQLSLRTLFVVNPTTVHEITANGWDEAHWRRERQTRHERTLWTLQALRLLAAAAVAAAVVRRPSDPMSVVGLLSFLPFLLLYPANYYATYLLPAAMLIHAAPRLAAALAALQAALWALSAWITSPLLAELLSWLSSLGLALVFAGFAAAVLLRRGPTPNVARGGVFVAAGLSVVGGAAALDAGGVRSAGGALSIDLIRQDFRDVRGATPTWERMIAWGNGWTGGDHVAFRVHDPASASAAATLQAPRAGRYDVKVDCTTDPTFGVVALSINGAAAGALVNLYAPDVGRVSVVVADVQLRAGSNAVVFRVAGRDPRAGGAHFAVDRIVLTPRDAPAPKRIDFDRPRKLALRRAVEWLEANPADAFDGGRRAIFAEVLALYCAARDGSDVVPESLWQPALRRRFDALSAWRAPLAHGEDAMLPAVVYVARRAGVPWQAGEALLAEVAASARDSIETGANPFLCAYLDRLSRSEARSEPPIPGGAVRARGAQPTTDHRRASGAVQAGAGAQNGGTCDPDRSVLRRDQTDRGLAALLSGPVDRDFAPRAALVLLVLAQEACALTDFGNEPIDRAGASPAGDQGVLLEPAGLSLDRDYWTDVCESAIRWGRETLDPLTVTRAVLLARLLDVHGDVSSLPVAVRDILRLQEADGSFGAASPRSPNPRRDAVVNAIMTLSVPSRPR